MSRKGSPEAAVTAASAVVTAASPGQETADAAASRDWWLYLLVCSDGRTYVGIALDVQARFAAHASGKGARFTRANRPLKILGAQRFATKSQALQAEHALKRLRREQRLQWAIRWPVE